jgi:hypothetical protein
MRAPEIVLVGIDEAAFSRLQEREPISRDYLAGLIRGLRKNQARLIGLDVDLRQRTLAADDRALEAAIRGSPKDAADLVHHGVAPRVTVFADPPDAVDREFIRRGIPYEDRATRSARQLVSLGVTVIEQIPRAATGTEDEGQVLPAWCDQRQFRSIVVVTNPDHSRRLHRVLQRSIRYGIGVHRAGGAVERSGKGGRSDRDGILFLGNAGESSAPIHHRPCTRSTRRPDPDSCLRGAYSTRGLVVKRKNRALRTLSP